MREPWPLTRWQSVHSPLPSNSALPRATSPAGAALGFAAAFARRNATTRSTCSSVRFGDGGIAVFGMPFSMMPASSLSVSARRNWPRPKSMPVIRLPSGPWQFAQIDANVRGAVLDVVRGGVLRGRVARDEAAGGEEEGGEGSLHVGGSVANGRVR